jgi:hypothetical protein
MASLASGFLVLSVVAGLVSLLAGMLLLLPLAVLALPWVLRRRALAKSRSAGRGSLPWRLSRG